MPVSRRGAFEAGGEVGEDVMVEVEAEEMLFVVAPEGVIICRPTPAIRRIRGLRANAPGARMYARAYSPLPRGLNRV